MSANTLKIPAAVDADNPRYQEVNGVGNYIEIASCTKPLWLELHGPQLSERRNIREGSKIWVDGKFTNLKFINADLNDAIHIVFSVSSGKVRVENNTGNRVPPTRLKTAIGVLNQNDEIEFDGVSNGQRRKMISVTNFTAASRLILYNDGNGFSGVGCLDVNAPGVWQRETDAKIKIKNLGAAPVTYGVGEDYYLD